MAVELRALECFPPPPPKEKLQFLLFKNKESSLLFVDRYVLLFQ